MIIPIELRFKADKGSKSAFRTEKTIKSHDVNSVEFHISIDGLELTDNYTAKILSVFHSSKSQANVDCEIVDGKIIYKPDTNLISRHEHVTNYVYVYHDNQSLDVREFIYVVDLSKIDETSLEVKEVYDQSYADLLADFEQALSDYKDNLPQADSVRADIDAILNQFSEDSQQVIGDLGELTTTVEIAEAGRVEKESERVQAETERKEAETLRETNYEQLIDTALIEADVVGKVDNKVTELTPQINNLTAQLAHIDKKINSLEINALYPPNGLSPLVPNANFYDDVNHKYYEDQAMTTPSHNNTSALQAMVDYLHANGGGTIGVPSGSYCFKSVNTKGVLWKSKVSMKGSGTGSTRFVVEGDLINLFYNLEIPATGDGVPVEDYLEDVSFEGFECDLIGLKQTFSDVNGKAFFILGMRRARFHNLLLKNSIGTALGCDFLTETVISNVVIYNAGRNWGVASPTGKLTTVGQSGIGIGAGGLEEETVVVKDCHVYHCGNYGIFIEKQGTSPIRSKFAKIINCHAEGNKTGISNKGSAETIINGCTSIKNEFYGIEARESSYGDVISDNIVSENGQHGVILDRASGSNTILSNNHIAKNGQAGIYSLADAAVDNPKRNVNIIGNRIGQNGYAGISLSNRHINTNIYNNYIYNNAQNQVNIHTDSGIAIPVADGLNIIGNFIFDDQPVKTQRVGLRFTTSDITNFIVSDNNVLGNSAASIVTSDFTSGVFDRNIGFATTAKGKSMIPNGEKIINVPYTLHKKATFVTVTVEGASAERIWVNSTLTNYFRVERTGVTGDLSFYWEVSV